MSVLLTVLLKSMSQESSIHAGYSLIRDSGPGTTDKAETFQRRAAFFFFPMKAWCLLFDGVRQSVPRSGVSRGYFWG